jgi:hypothetical protein
MCCLQLQWILHLKLGPLCRLSILCLLRRVDEVEFPQDRFSASEDLLLDYDRLDILDFSWLKHLSQQSFVMTMV